MSEDSAKEIQRALYAAHNGGASFSQLVRAHELAEEAELPHTVAELRKHIHRSLPSTEKVAVIRSVGLGIISGMITHFLLGLKDRARR